MTEVPWSAEMKMRLDIMFGGRVAFVAYRDLLLSQLQVDSSQDANSTLIMRWKGTNPF